jgi:hypothetical protein
MIATDPLAWTASALGARASINEHEMSKAKNKLIRHRLLTICVSLLFNKIKPKIMK